MSVFAVTNLRRGRVRGVSSNERLLHNRYDRVLEREEEGGGEKDDAARGAGAAETSRGERARRRAQRGEPEVKSDD